MVDEEEQTNPAQQSSAQTRQPAPKKAAKINENPRLQSYTSYEQPWTWRKIKDGKSKGRVQMTELRTACEKIVSQGLTEFASDCFKLFFKQDELDNKRCGSVTLLKGTNALANYTQTNTPDLFNFFNDALQPEFDGKNSAAKEFLREYIGDVLIHKGDVDITKLLPDKIRRNVSLVSTFVKKNGVKQVDQAMTDLVHDIHNRLLERDTDGELLINKLKYYVEQGLENTFGKKYTVEFMNSHRIKMEHFADYVLISTHRSPLLKDYDFECKEINMHRIDHGNDDRYNKTTECFPVRQSTNLTHIEFKNLRTQKNSHFALLRDALVIRVKDNSGEWKTFACNFFDVSIPLENDSFYDTGKTGGIKEKIESLKNTITRSTGSLVGAPVPTLAYLIEDNAGQLANLSADLEELDKIKSMKNNSALPDSFKSQRVGPEENITKKALNNKIDRLQKRTHVMDIVMAYEYLKYSQYLGEFNTDWNTINAKTNPVFSSVDDNDIMGNILRIIGQENEYYNMISWTLVTSNLYTSNEINQLINAQLEVRKYNPNIRIEELISNFIQLSLENNKSPHNVNNVRAAPHPIAVGGKGGRPKAVAKKKSS